MPGAPLCQAHNVYGFSRDAASKPVRRPYGDRLRDGCLNEVPVRCILLWISRRTNWGDDLKLLKFVFQAQVESALRELSGYDADRETSLRTV